MFNINSFLSKFSRNINAIELNKQEIANIIEKNTKIKIPIVFLEIKDNIVMIEANGAVKNKIFIFKSKILEEVNSTLPIKITDIR